MSKIILGWQLNRPLDDVRVRALMEQIGHRYQRLFLERLRCVGLWQGNQGLLHLDVPRAADAGLDRTDDRICCITGRPTTSGQDSPLETVPLSAAALYNRLVTSTSAIQADVVRRLNPPFTLCWFDRRGARLGIVHDGLGQDQFFVSHTAAGLVFSNRCWPILRLLGEVPRIDMAAWKYWFCMGWFPGTATPFQDIRALDSGQIIVGDSRTVSSTTSGALPWWIERRGGQDTATLMVRAAEGVRGVVSQNQPAAGEFSADLTGGIDSRAICSLLIKDGFRSRYYTGGSRLSPDVVLARRIARRFGLDWTHVEHSHSAQRADLEDIVDIRFRRMTLWGEGLVEPTRFQHFQAAPSPTSEDPYLGGGSSEISKGHYYHNVLRPNPEAAFDLDRSLQDLTRGAFGLLADQDASSVAEVVRQQLAEGARYGVGDWALLDYFYLRERTRRWQSAHLAVNLFDVSILPFVNTDHITLAFAMRPADKANSAFQRFIIQRNEEALLRIPLSAEVSRHPYFVALGFIPRIRRLSRVLKTSDWVDYFRNGGRASVDRVLSTDSPLWEILDRPRAAKKWNDFRRGATPDLHFALGLLAFSYWHAMFVEDALP